MSFYVVVLQKALKEHESSSPHKRKKTPRPFDLNNSCLPARFWTNWQSPYQNHMGAVGRCYIITIAVNVRPGQIPR